MVGKNRKINKQGDVYLVSERNTWPKIKKFILLGFELGFLAKKLCKRKDSRPLTSTCIGAGEYGTLC